MDISRLLYGKHNTLLSSYHDHLDGVRATQTTLLDRVLPSILEDGTRRDEAAFHRSREWIMDTGALYRAPRQRHKFTASFALEALHDTLLWRLESLPAGPPMLLANKGFMHCLPPPACDVFGRPVVIIRLSAFKDNTYDTGQTQQYILYALESLRCHLVRLNSESNGDLNPILQCILLLDLENASMKILDVDILSWYIREAMPRFPGLLAAALILNSSWAQSGTWSVVKHVLPDSALSRIIFLNKSTLSLVIPPASLPRDYGGDLPPLADLPSVLAPSRCGSPDPIVQPNAVYAVRSQRPSWRRPSVSPRSLSNPFFGYPVSEGNLQPTPTHGRLRKRDLVRTLVLLFWDRWRAYL
ncbi:CRAL-TRIO domain-containing protein, partial [Vararia minispora EC-137]